MSDLNDNFDDLDGTDLLKALRKAVRDNAKVIAQLSEENKTLKGQTRERTVVEKLSSRGLDAKVAKLIPGDADDVDAWLDEFGELFGAKPAATEGGETAEPDPEADAQRRISNLGGSPALSSEAELAQKLSDPNLTEVQLLALIAGA